MQMDTALPFGYRKHGTLRNRDECVFPQLSLLEELHEEAPNATFILVFRPVEDWIRSIKGWNDMLPRFRDCDLPNSPRGYPADLRNQSDVNESMTRFFCSHVVHLRNFVALHPSHALIELDLYDGEGLLETMTKIFTASNSSEDGMPSSKNTTECWKIMNKSK